MDQTIAVVEPVAITSLQIFIWGSIFTLVQTIIAGVGLLAKWLMDRKDRKDKLDEEAERDNRKRQEEIEREERLIKRQEVAAAKVADTLATTTTETKNELTGIKQHINGYTSDLLRHTAAFARDKAEATKSARDMVEADGWERRYLDHVESMKPKPPPGPITVKVEQSPEDPLLRVEVAKVVAPAIVPDNPATPDTLETS